ncbi:MAG: hypothetical protein Q8N15_07255, partial [Bacillota bacterium]|nr:hypothetical protein [Bacillota bacterium]
VCIPSISSQGFWTTSQDWVGFYDLQPNTEYQVHLGLGIGTIDTPYNSYVYIGDSIIVSTLPLE